MQALVFKGATKPSMLWGAPQIPLIITIGISVVIISMLISWTPLRLWGLCFAIVPAIAFIVMYEKTKQDDQAVNLFFEEWRTRLWFLTTSNRAGAMTYIPAQHTSTVDTL